MGNDLLFLCLQVNDPLSHNPGSGNMAVFCKGNYYWGGAMFHLHDYGRKGNTTFKKRSYIQNKGIEFSHLLCLGGGFKYFFIFIPIWGRFPIWLIFFNWVETTNQLLLSKCYISFQLHHPTNPWEVLRAAEAPCGWWLVKSSWISPRNSGIPRKLRKIVMPLRILTPQEMSILRTYTPLLCSFKPFFWRVRVFFSVGAPTDWQWLYLNT